MSDRRLAAVILVATGALAGAVVPSTAHAGGGGAFLPPMRVDVGPSVSSIEDAPAGQVVAGIHWASVYPKGKAGFDVGIGIVSTFRGTDDDATATARVTDPMAEADDPLGVFGGYVEVAARTAGNGWWRNWVGMRVESGRAGWDHRSRPYVGLAARVSTEAYLSGAAGAASRPPGCKSPAFPHLADGKPRRRTQRSGPYPAGCPRGPCCTGNDGNIDAHSAAATRSARHLVAWRPLEARVA